MKSKKILTILLSLAIMLTFMPTMAFATNGTGGQTVKSWGTGYASVTEDTVDEATFVTTRTFNNETGKTVAVGQDYSNSTVQGEKKLAPSSGAYFYDLTDSFFASGNTKLDGSTWTSDEFYKTIYSDGTLNGILVQQAYDFVYDATYNTNATTYDAAKVAKKSFGFTQSGTDKTTWTLALDNWELTAKMKGYDPTEKGEQTVTFELSAPVAGSAVTAATVQYDSTPDLFGTIAKATVTVKAATATAGTASYYLDAVGSDFTAVGVEEGGTPEVILGLYDGAAHTLVADAVEGWTPEYAVYNTSTGRYDTGAATITNVQDDNMLVRITWKKSGRDDVVRYVEMNLRPATPFWGFGFTVNKEGKDSDGYPVYSAVYDVVGTDYNAADYFGIAVEPNGKYDDSRILAGKAATQAAVAANQTELMSFFNDFYDIEAKAAKGGITPVTLSVSPKSLGTTTSAQQKAYKALVAKYATLIANFGMDEVESFNYFLTPVTGETVTTATLNLNSELVDEEIEFTKAISSKVVHVKKAKKLKKNVSFTVKAVSNKGRAVSYKLINANSKIVINKSTGKITLKKGLKKGTYKIKVKAYVAGSSTAAGGQIEETQAITINLNSRLFLSLR